MYQKSTAATHSCSYPHIKGSNNPTDIFTSIAHVQHNPPCCWHDALQKALAVISSLKMVWMAAPTLTAAQLTRLPAFLGTRPAVSQLVLSDVGTVPHAKVAYWLSHAHTYTYTHIYTRMTVILAYICSNQKLALLLCTIHSLK
jgi:hypothetical protein